MRRWQFPGQVYTFVDRQTKETDSGVLPSVYGESSDFAVWHSHPEYKNGGTWRSKRLHREQEKRRLRGGSSGGVLSRMRAVLKRFRSECKRRGYESPVSTPEQMVSEWSSQEGKCAACKGSLSLYGTRKNRGACYDHNHETGEARGFIHEHCNLAEGSLLRMSNEEFSNYIEWITKLHDRKEI